MPAAGPIPVFLLAHALTPLVLRAAWCSLGMLDLPGGSLAATLIAENLLAHVAIACTRFIEKLGASPDLHSRNSHAPCRYFLRQTHVLEIVTFTKIGH